MNIIDKTQRSRIKRAYNFNILISPLAVLKGGQKGFRMTRTRVDSGGTRT
jgi:hypothetical protein